jgi:hypothetical protein
MDMVKSLVNMVTKLSGEMDRLKSDLTVLKLQMQNLQAQLGRGANCKLPKLNLLIVHRLLIRRESYKDVAAASRGPSAARVSSGINEETSVIHPTYCQPLQVSGDPGFTDVRSRRKRSSEDGCLQTVNSSQENLRFVVLLRSVRWPKWLGQCLHFCNVLVLL